VYTRRGSNDYLVSRVCHCADFDELLDVARTWNEELLDHGYEPLEDTILIRRARVVWQHHQQGRFVPMVKGDDAFSTSSRRAQSGDEDDIGVRRLLCPSSHGSLAGRKPPTVETAFYGRLPNRRKHSPSGAAHGRSMIGEGLSLNHREPC